MPTPNHPPEWVQHALRAEVEAAVEAAAELMGVLAEGGAQLVALGVEPHEFTATAVH